MYHQIISEIIGKYNTEISTSQPSIHATTYLGKYGLKKECYTVKTDAQALAIKKDVGVYTLVSFLNIFNSSRTMLHYLVNHLSLVIKQYVGEINPNSKILVVALGNQSISADSLGYHTIKNVITTRTLTKVVPTFNHMPQVSAIATSVLGKTGIESKEIIQGIISQIKPNKVIIIDTLCATNYKRLGTSFQINNAGIAPGGGVGNERPVINKQNTGVDVISVGVPLVMYAKSLVSNAIEGICFETLIKGSEESKKIKQKVVTAVLNKIENYNYNNLILTFKDIEEQVAVCGRVLSYAINKALLGFNIAKQMQVLDTV